MIIDELTGFSNFYGSNEELVLAGGGNTSAKDGNVMYIKGSGTSLSTITADGFVKTDRTKLAEIFTKVYPDNDKEREAESLKDLFSARLPGEEKRPSVETTLHSLFEYRFVLHLHPALVNGLTCASDGEKCAKELFGNNVLWIEPCKPGYILAKICFDAMKEYKEVYGKACDIVLLANHGVFVAADTVDGLDEKLSYVLETIGKANEYMPDFDTGEFYPDEANDAFEKIEIAYSQYGDDYIINYEPSVQSIEFCKSEEDAKPLLKPFTPDHTVYCKAYPVYAEKPEEIPALVEKYKAENGFLPKIILVKKCGFFAVDNSVKGAQTAAMLFNDAMKIAVYSKSFGGARHMSDELTDFIVNWEAESYRSKQNS